MAITIALAGNPNCGKTTMFNDLTGSNQFVGNWPGVTVEKKEGKLKGHKDVIITDLPGIYSLSPYTLEEVVTRNYLIGEHPDVILNLVDGSNIERNLYLTTQLTEMGIPVVIALNMMDIVKKNGDVIDTKKLSDLLGCQVIETSAVKNEGSMEAAEAAVKMALQGGKTTPQHVFSKPVEDTLDRIGEIADNFIAQENKRWYAVKLFERDEKALESLKLPQGTLAELEKAITSCEEELDDDSESIITNERYNAIAKVIKACVKKKRGGLSTSDKIDRIVTNRFLALPIFAVVMFFVYYISVSTVGDLLTGFTNDTLFGEWISPAVESFLVGIGCADWLTGLIVDGIVGGVGAVLGFVPQMLVLFLMLCALEDCGYMARIAFIMDRIFRRFGLSGKSFIPMLIGSGCGVPGIMASRTIEQDRDRKMTIMTTTFIPCGAKMPIVALIAGALFGGAWWVAPSAYFIGVAAIIISGIILKKTKLFAGDPAPFVMELPQYHLPTVKNVLRGTWERGSSFIKKAGTVILLSSIFVWFTSSFGFVDGTFGMVDDIDASVLASIGSVVAPVFAPLGFGNWQTAVATVLGLVAKEEVVGALGTIYAVAGDALELVEEGAFGELGAIAQHFTALSAYSFLVFNLLCAPCFAAIGAIKREMNNAKWTWFAIGYQTVFAYTMSFMLYQFGLLFTGAAGFSIGTAIAAVILVVYLWLLFRKGYVEKPTRLRSVDTVEA
ncbi:ferrous iron transport protein B [Merdimmobilis hominis]|uniref:ferrous iron transport protein B n=1 Tax=Merdimmobilis hominis TaxID=2897707 RepID=UPI0008F87AAC|nr:ferrous iron transport protein B [Merdimmobilis hominis]MCD4835393.1 ferrous iron transport protein B [Merdimmobilis hominis]PWL60933.1 MAG: ferrous iron transport protein B [Oscillospiraceae bacterium]